MRAVEILLPSSHSEEEFRVLFGRLGGRWTDDPSPGYGVFVKGDASLYATFIPDVVNSIDMNSDEELARFRQKLDGRDAKSMVSIEIGHSPGSERLAREMATRIATEWGGVQDWSEAE